MAEVRIRAATADDAPDAARILAAHRDEPVAGWAERFLAAAVDPDQVFLVAEVDGRVVGFGQARELAPAASIPDAPPPGWYLSGLTVEPSARRRGVGEALTVARVGLLVGRADVVHYLALADNAATIRLHARLGFVAAGTVRVSTEDRLLLHFTLDLAAATTRWSGRPEGRFLP